MKILLVDDDLDCLNNLKEAIEPTGYECVLFQSPKDGFDALQKNAFDAIITDFRMPDMNGIELIKEIKNYNPHIPIIMITGCAFVDDAICALNNGAYAVFCKPLKFHDLIEMLANIDQQKRQYRLKIADELNILAGENFRLNNILSTMQNEIIGYSPARIDS